jgi:predicted nicotinamide N-methyase
VLGACFPRIHLRRDFLPVHDLVSSHERSSTEELRLKDFSSFLREATRITAPDLCPEIRLHLGELSRLWAEQEQWTGRLGLPPPFWGVAWPGGQAIARYILDNPALVRGLSVLDVGSGSGLCAIAAAKAGARAVEAADTDTFSRQAILANASLNRVSVVALQDDLIGALSRWDVVLAGDVWYEKFLAERMTSWLRQLEIEGARVLLGDRGRAFFPRGGLTELGRYAIRASQSLERETITMTGVWKIGRG